MRAPCARKCAPRVHGLSGRIRIAAIPTALAMMPRLTTPFREKHPGVTFSILSRTSIEILSLLGNLDVDVGITYLDNEPLGRVVSAPLYSETLSPHHRLR
jgi:DNA-binding transcriptional LysR family regulator